MSRLRITMVTTFYPPYNFGGDGMGVQRLSQALARRGFDVTVVHQADAYVMLAGAEPGPAAMDDGVKVVPLKSALGPLSNLATHQLGKPVAHAHALKALLGRDKTDIIWFHNISLIGGPGLLTYGSGLKVYEAHEHWLVCPTHVLWRFNKERCDERQCLPCVLSYKRPPQLWRATGALERAGSNVDVFIAKSAFSRDKHREFGFPFEMQVVPYFLPEEPQGQLGAEPSHDRPFFLFVGRLEKIKGLQDVIPAFRTGEGADLLVIGSGEYEAELRKQAEGASRVKFLGRKPPEALGRYYRDALALITPSICFETFGIVLIEAFRRGLPVIARRLGPFPEIVEKSGAGLLFETEAELASAMDSMTTDTRLRETMRSAASQSFVANWSEGAVMQRYLDVLYQAARGRGMDFIADALRERQIA